MRTPHSLADQLGAFPGDMAARVRAHPWESSPLGPMEAWPQSLTTAVSMLLECQLPMYLAWGDEFTQIYNDAYCPILGNKHLGALGGSARDTWSEIWPKIGPMWQDVLDGKPVGFDDFKLTIDRFGYAEDCYFNFSYSAVRNEQGGAMGVLVTFAETTKRVLAERRLRFLDELSQATRSVSEPSEVMNIAATLLGQHLGVNRCAYARVLADEDTFDLIGDYNQGVNSIVGRYKFTDFGAEVQRLMLEDVAYVNHDVDTSPVTAGTDLAAYRITQIQSVICVPLHKVGRFVAAMAVHQSVPRRWKDDEIELVRTVVDRCWDALDRLRAQAALQEEARSLEVLNRTGTSLAAELNLDVVLQRVTDAATELTGAKYGAFFYNGVSDTGEAYMLYTLSGAPRHLFETLGHPRPTALFGPTFRGGPPIRLDDVLSDERYGQWAPHHGMPLKHLPVRSYLAVPVVGRTGEVIGGLFFGHSEVGVFSERSERLALGIASQAAIAVDNARLYTQAQQAAHERALLLESERAARHEAERSSVIKDEFLSTLSHELRTPLSAITGWVHILRRKLDGAHPDVLKGLEVIHRSAQMQVQLVDDLLDMSRITSGKLSMEMKPVSPRAIVEAAVDVVRPRAEAAGVTLAVDVQDTAAALGDASRLQQAVWNLLCNGVKFSAKGGTVQVKLHEEDSRALIRVSDDGVGIKPEFLPHVFDRFRQADSSTTRHFGGLGLGLAIVRSVVDLHGGQVTADSAGEGRGASFSIALPLAWAEAPDLAGLATGAREGMPGFADSSSRLTGTSVLVVDDDLSSRELLRRVLEEAGAQVSSAENAYLALEQVKTRRFDVIVSDIGMPGMDGFALLRSVRQLTPAQGGSTPAIALTAFARVEDRERALASGYTVHLSKPLDPPAIVQAVWQLRERGSPQIR
jgi:signal transduction histidine kinase/ActR/RegA family two-component response regulator